MKLSAFVSTAMLGAALALPAGALAQDHGSPGGLLWSECNVAEVATTSNRVHVRCVGTGWIFPFFASPTSSSAEAARLVALGTAAMLGAGKLFILSDTTTSSTEAASYGCLAHDCRRPLEMRLKK